MWDQVLRCRCITGRLGMREPQAQEQVSGLRWIQVDNDKRTSVPSTRSPTGLLGSNTDEVVDLIVNEATRL